MGRWISLAIRVVFLEDGDHPFRLRIRSGRTEGQNLDQAIEAVAGFVAGL